MVLAQDHTITIRTRPARRNTRSVTMGDFLGIPIEHAAHLAPGLDMLPAVAVDQVADLIIGVEQAIGVIEYMDRRGYKVINATDKLSAPEIYSQEIGPRNRQ